MSAAATSIRLTERTRNARLIREALSLLQSKWSVDVLLALGDGSRRYHELLGDLEPISEKVLTQTLRAMERDGLIHRRVHAEVPPRVDYALTPLGATLAAPMRALGSWSLARGQHVEAARERFDMRRAIQRQQQQHRQVAA
jgi:DNA-binding HxlR family transcriptional regulator